MLCRVVWVSGTLVCQMWSVHLHHGVQSVYAQHTHCACTWLHCCEATLSQHSQTLSVMCSYRAYSYVCLINTVGQARVSSLRLCKSDLHWANVQFVTGHQCEQHGKPCPPITQLLLTVLQEAVCRLGKEAAMQPLGLFCGCVYHTEGEAWHLYTVLQIKNQILQTSLHNFNNKQMLSQTLLEHSSLRSHNCTLSLYITKLFI